MRIDLNVCHVIVFLRDRLVPSKAFEAHIGSTVTTIEYGKTGKQSTQQIDIADQCLEVKEGEARDMKYTLQGSPLSHRLSRRASVVRPTGLTNDDTGRLQAFLVVLDLLDSDNTES